MNLLGLDTSTAASSACLLRGDGEAFEIAPDRGALAAPPAHARELMPAIARAMDRAGVTWDGVGAIAVGRGPGPFTGLRIGIATARALAMARGILAHPVSSLAALAAGIDAPLALPLIDARRGEVFAALYEGSEERWEAFVAAPERVVERVRSAGVNPVAAGDGALRFRDALESSGLSVAEEASKLHAVRALHVCRLAARVPAVPPEAVLPDYLRAPDARPAR